MQGFQELRPQSWDEFVGQTKAVAQIRKWANQGILPHLILVGPPGSGKTTIMGLLEKQFSGVWIKASSGDFSTKELREGIERAREQRQQLGAGKVFLVLDEVHRLNRVQQDLLLEPLEKYEIVLVAATTEIPQGVLAPAFLSRVRVLRLETLKEAEIHELLRKAAAKLDQELTLDRLLQADAQGLLVERGLQDLRGALRGLQMAWLDWKARVNSLTAGASTGAPPATAEEVTLSPPLTAEEVTLSPPLTAEEVTLSPPLTAEELSNLLGEAVVSSQGPTASADALSALIKSLRGSDPDAAVLWLAQLEALGMPSEQIARRMVILAAEDIGNAEPRALTLAQSAVDACRWIGWPEAGIVLSQVAIFLACAPKSNSAYRAIQNAREVIQTQGLQEVPLPLTARGRAHYQNPHDLSHQGGPSPSVREPSPGLAKNPGYLPKALLQKTLVPRSTRSFEKKMWEYLDWLRGEKAPERGPAPVDPKSEPTI